MFKGVSEITFLPKVLFVPQDSFEHPHNALDKRLGSSLTTHVDASFRNVLGLCVTHECT